MSSEKMNPERPPELPDEGGSVIGLARYVAGEMAGSAFRLGRDTVGAAADALGAGPALRRAARLLDDVAGPVGEVPDQVRSLAGRVASAVPVHAVTDFAGSTVDDWRAALRAEGQALLWRSAALDDPVEFPALQGILRMLSPDEARIVRFLGEEGARAVIDVVAFNPMTRKYRELLHNFSMVAREAGCIRYQHASIYLDNLLRLGLVHIHDFQMRSEQQYEMLAFQPEVTGLVPPSGLFVRLRHHRKGVELSEFGKVLYDECFVS